MLGYHSMGAADYITAIMSDPQQYNMHNMYIKTQPHKYICIPIYKHTINKKEPKANITPPLRNECSPLRSRYEAKMAGAFVKGPLSSQVAFLSG